MSRQQTEGILVYVGTFTTREHFVRGAAEGIHVFRLDPAGGTLRQVSVTAPVVNPAFLSLHPSNRFLYAVNEIYTSDGGAVSAFAIDSESGALTFLNRQPSHGEAPCHISVAGGGRFLLVANYQTGSIAVLPIAADGSLEAAGDVVQHVGSSVHPQRQQGPHAHSITPDPTGRFALVCDLGLDRVLVYRLDTARGTLTPHERPWTQSRAGAGPRHLDFHPNGRWVYVINELDSTLDAFTFDQDTGALERLQSVSTLPEGFHGSNTTADVHVAPSGRFVYGSNRGHDSIAVFAVDGQTGQLSPVAHTSTQGRTPRNFAIDRTGTWLFAANQDSDTIVPFRIDPHRGTLEQAGAPVSVPTPVCVRIMPT
jgi:6-phosphogluconolactonase